MDLLEFKKLAETYKTIPVYKKILADLLTPISAYMRLEKNAEYAFILESVEKGEQYGRYSFIGRNPEMVLSSENGKTQLKKNGEWEGISSEYLSVLRQIQSKHQAPKLQGMPHFTGGLVGYLGYESIVWVEDIPIHEKGEFQCPDSIFMLYNDMIAFDHLQNQIILFSNVQIDEGLDLENSFEKAHVRIDIQILIISHLYSWSNPNYILTSVKVNLKLQ
jgi:anthranilate synthase component 1